MGRKGHKRTPETVTQVAKRLGSIVLVPSGHEVDLEAVYSDSIILLQAMSRATIEGKLDRQTNDSVCRNEVTKLAYCMQLEKARGCDIEDDIIDV